MFKKYFELIRQEHFEITKFSRIVVDRYYATIILNQAITEREETDIGEVLLHDYDMLSSSVKSFSDSCFHVGEALLLVGEFQMAWEILTNNCSKALDVPDCLKGEFELQVRILKLLSGILSGNVSPGRADLLYKEFSGNPLPFLSENYLSIFLQFIRHKVNPKPSVQRDVKDNLDAFIAKTGFTYFEEYYQSYIV